MTTLRQCVVEEARTWLGTPYRLGARVKGAGCDCATLLFMVYRHCGLIGDEEIGVFAGDWWAHTTEEKYLFRLLRHAGKVAESIAYASIQAEPGNIALTRVAKSKVFNHGGIILAWPRIVHAIGPAVREVDASRDPMWAYREIIILNPFRDGGPSGGDALHPEGVVAGEPSSPPSDDAATPALSEAAAPAPSRGLGDMVARVTKLFGFKECGGCAKRRAWLNRMAPL